MKKRLFASVIAAATLFTSLNVTALEQSNYGQIPAFPGAEGAGMYATGGRGGEIYIVDSLEDYLPTSPAVKGTLRDAVSKGNRIIIFKVSGTIELKANLNITASNITIAGQTSPGGICIKDYAVGIGGENVIVRFLRFRPGDNKQVELDAVGGAPSLAVIDHVSATWGTDENLSFYGTKDCTVQWSIIAESNFHSVHESGCHAFGGLNGGENYTFHHNLMAHNVSRNTRLSGSGNTEIINNVIYDWGYKNIYGDWKNLNLIGNYFKYGPSTPSNYYGTTIEIAETSYKTYMDGNYISGSEQATADNWQVPYYKNSVTESDVRLEEPIDMYNLNGQNVSMSPTSYDQAYDDVIKYVGASAPKRDNTDTRIVNDVINKTGNLKFTVYPVDPSTGQTTQSILANGTVVNHTEDEWARIQQFSGVHWEYEWDDLSGGEYPKDSNNDGIPDEWCIERGLNPYDNSVARGDYTGDGYTNIEKYINDLTVDAFPEGTVTISPVTQNSVDVNEYELKGINVDFNNITDANSVVLPNTTESGYNITWASISDELVIENNVIKSVARQADTDIAVQIVAEITTEYGTSLRHFDGIIKAENPANTYFESFDSGIDSTWKASDENITAVSSNAGDGSSMFIQSNIDSCSSYVMKSFDVDSMKGSIAQLGFKFNLCDVPDSSTLKWNINDESGEIIRIWPHAEGNDLVTFKVFSGSGNSWSYVRTADGSILKIPKSENKFYEIKLTIDYKNQYNDFYNPKYDVAIYDGDKLIGSNFGAQRQNLTSEYTGKITSMSIGYSSVGLNKGVYIDDLYIKNLSTDVQNAADRMIVFNPVYDGDFLQSKTVNGVDVIWSAENSDVATVYEDGLVLTDETSPVPVQLKATLQAGNPESINESTEKSIDTTVVKMAPVNNTDEGLSEKQGFTALTNFDFEDTSLDMWGFTNKNNTVSKSIDTTNPLNHVLEIKGGTTTNTPGVAMYEIPVLGMTNTYAVEFDIYHPEAESGDTFVRVGDDNGNDIFSLYARESESNTDLNINGKVMRYGLNTVMGSSTLGDNANLSAKYTTTAETGDVGANGTWYHVLSVMDFDKKTQSLVIKNNDTDDIIVNIKDAAISNASALNRISVGYGWITDADYPGVWLDNLRIYEKNETENIMIDYNFEDDPGDLWGFVSTRNNAEKMADDTAENNSVLHIWGGTTTAQSAFTTLDLPAAEGEQLYNLEFDMYHAPADKGDTYIRVRDTSGNDIFSLYARESGSNTDINGKMMRYGFNTVMGENVYNSFDTAKYTTTPLTGDVGSNGIWYRVSAVIDFENKIQTLIIRNRDTDEIIVNDNAEITNASDLGDISIGYGWIEDPNYTGVYIDNFKLSQRISSCSNIISGGNILNAVYENLKINNSVSIDGITQPTVVLPFANTTTLLLDSPVDISKGVKEISFDFTTTGSTASQKRYIALKDSKGNTVGAQIVLKWNYMYFQNGISSKGENTLTENSLGAFKEASWNNIKILITPTEATLTLNDNTHVSVPVTSMDIAAIELYSSSLPSDRLAHINNFDIKTY